MKKRRVLTGIILLLALVLFAAPALAAPQDAYTKTGLENEIADGNLQKLWVLETLMMQTMQNGKLQKGNDMLVFGEAVYCEDSTPVNGYVLVYYYRWGYASTGEVACYLKAAGYVPANHLSERQPGTSANYGGGYSGGGCGCPGGVGLEQPCPGYPDNCDCEPYACDCP